MTRPPRIMHLTSSLEVGGAERVLVRLNKALALRPDVYNVVAILNDVYNPELLAQLKESGVQVHLLGRKQSAKNPLFILKLIRLIRQHRVDIIQTYQVGSKFWGCLCKLLLPYLRLVYRISNNTILPGYSRLNQIIDRQLVDRHVCLSRLNVSQCHEQGLRKTSHIYNGIQLDHFGPKQQTPGFHQPLRLINVARVSRDGQKGQDILLRALAICKEQGLRFHCSFVGGIPQYAQVMYENLQQLIQTLGLESEIEFTGVRTDIAEQLRQSDIFVFPSRFEGIPSSLLEAMANGLPVIASDIPGNSELITHQASGLLYPVEDYEALAKHLLHLASNPDEAAKLGANAALEARNFGLDAMVNRYVEMYHSLLE